MKGNWGGPDLKVLQFLGGTKSPCSAVQHFPVIAPRQLCAEMVGEGSTSLTCLLAHVPQKGKMYKPKETQLLC